MENALTLTWMIIQVVLLDILLSGDNAIVIAMAAGRLPQRLRRTAIIIGTGGAVLIRFLMAAAIVWLLQIPYLRIAGGMLLIFIGINLLCDKSGEEDGAGGSARDESLMQAVTAIIMANVTMSLDNVMGIVGVVEGNMWLIFIGMCISAPIIMFGSEFFVYLIDRFPVILYLGGGILGWAAGEMILNDPHMAFLAPHHLMVGIVCVSAILGISFLWNSVGSLRKNENI